MDYKEKVIIVGVDLDKPGDDFEASMAELEGLVEASGGEVVGIITQKRKGIQTATYIGKGKIDEIAQLLEVTQATTLIMNDELSGSQMRNLEAILDAKIVDRTNLILDIFAIRAKSREGLIQVQLAQLKYRLPRLQGFYGALSRTGGGIGTRGPGEQQIDTDRRHILRQILNLEKQLESVVMSRKINRKKRVKSNLPVIAFVGYTNAGKSSLINAFLKYRTKDVDVKEVFVKDMLFATLDAAYRRVTLNNGLPVLLTDTVGFVSRLPHDLVAAFRSTMEEITYADIIVHVIDASNPNKDIQMETTQDVLRSLDVGDTQILTVYNKMDLIDVDYHSGSIQNTNQLLMSSKSKYDIDLMVDMLEDKLMDFFVRERFMIPYEDMSKFDEIASVYQVEAMHEGDKGVSFICVISKEDAKKYSKYIVQ